MEEKKRKLAGMTLNDLTAAVKEAGMPAFTAKQIADWVYKKRAGTIDEMSNISLKNRTRLNELFEVGYSAPADAARSVDGTVKYLYRVDNNHFVEAVYIPRGAFFQKTGGRWIYVVDATGERAYRREIRIGRQNPRFYEILEGLAPGEKVITSSYDNFGDNEELILK